MANASQPHSLQELNDGSSEIYGKADFEVGGGKALINMASINELVRQ